MYMNSIACTLDTLSILCCNGNYEYWGGIGKGENECETLWGFCSHVGVYGDYAES
jgi:hypothetical protein